MSLSHIDNYRLDGEITLLLGQKTDYDGGGVTDILAGELKNIGRNSVFYHIVNY